MSIDRKIIECELEYIKCFSELYKNEDVIRFFDNQLYDMYYHNYTYIKKAMSEIELNCIIENEISLRLSEKSNFCNIISNYAVNSSLLSMLKYKPQIINKWVLFL